MIKALRIECVDCGSQDFSASSSAEIYILQCDECGARWTSKDHGIPEVRLDRALVSPGLVYFISGTSPDSPVKIGFSVNSVEARLASLQTGNPEKLEVLAVICGSLTMERAFHAVFAEHRLQGEWFKRTPELMRLIGAVRLMGAEEAKVSAGFGA